MKVRFAFGTFRPTKPLLFSNNKALIFSSPELLRNTYLGQTLTYGFTAFFGFRAVLATSGTELLSWLLQSGLFFGGAILSSRVFYFSRSFAMKVYLRSDGKTLEVYNGLLHSYFKPREIRIEDIAQECKQRENLMRGNLKVILTKNKNDIFLLMDGAVHEKELLENILQGNSVEVKEKGDAIDI